DRALLTLLGLPAALFEPAAHDDPCAFGEGRTRVLGELAPRSDVEEARLLLPLLRVLITPGPVHRDAEGDLRNAARRVAHLGFASDVARDGDAVRVGCHADLPM